VGALQIVDHEDQVLVVVLDAPETVDAAFDDVRVAAELIERSDSHRVEVIVGPPGLSTVGRFLVRAVALQAEARGKTVNILFQPLAS
jgi:hypothetical protein